MKIINKAIEVLKNGGVILYPTDTIWGIGCDATNKTAIEKIYKIKKREESKSLITLVANKKMLFKYTRHIPEFNILIKPTTVIYPKVYGLPKILMSQNSSAIRIPCDYFCKTLIKEFGNPIVSTSANISGEENPNKFSDISNEIKNNVDYIVNLRQDKIMKNPSRILKIELNGTLTKIR